MDSKKWRVAVVVVVDVVVGDAVDVVVGVAVV